MKLLLGIVGLLLALFVAACIPHNLRLRRARAAARRVSRETRTRALELLAAAGRGAPATTLLVPGNADALVAGRGLSKVGGRALGRDEVLPEPAGDAREGDVFLLQVELAHASLPEVWRGRLVTVHLVDWEPVVHAFAPGEVAALRPLALPRTPLRERRLLHVPLPARAASRAAAQELEDGPPPAYDPDGLLESVPALAALLADHGTTARDVLAQLLQVDGGGYAPEAPDLAFEGGSPEYIQGERRPWCPSCRTPLRFLFQFGQLFHDFPLADGGVGYVFGCDAHPDELEAWIDSH